MARRGKGVLDSHALGEGLSSPPSPHVLELGHQAVQLLLWLAVATLGVPGLSDLTPCLPLSPTWLPLRDVEELLGGCLLPSAVKLFWYKLKILQEWCVESPSLQRGLRAAREVKGCP